MERECSSCGCAIHPDRLEALPNTHYCTACSGKNPTPPRHDPNVLCAKASVSARNGFAPQD